ncbi:hypothetical protein YC2023_118743 [Brassica napus]
MHSLRRNNFIFEAASKTTREALLNPSTFPEFKNITSVINAFQQAIETTQLLDAAANAIASSVTAGHRSQSYIASGGPVWLHPLVASETGDNDLCTLAIILGCCHALQSVPS